MADVEDDAGGGVDAGGGDAEVAVARQAEPAAKRRTSETAEGAKPAHKLPAQVRSSCPGVHRSKAFALVIMTYAGTVSCVRVLALARGSGRGAGTGTVFLKDWGVGLGPKHPLTTSTLRGSRTALDTALFVVLRVDWFTPPC